MNDQKNKFNKQAADFWPW